MGGGMSIHNDTSIEVLVILSHTGPLHWITIAPGRTEDISCGKVWYTLDVRLIGHKSEPTSWEVAKPFVIGIGLGVGVVAGGLIAAVPAVATAAGATIGVAVKTASVGAGIVGTSLATATGATAGALTYESIKENKMKREVIRQEQVEKWMKFTPSEKSARWLAENNITEVVPATMSGVYADEKTITISCAKEEIDEDTNMLKLIIKITEKNKIS